MDITSIHAISFATRIGQVAAAEISAWLNFPEEDFVLPHEIWFDPDRPSPEDDAGGADEIAARSNIVDALGEYVCSRQVEGGERLFRHAVGQRLIAPPDSWPDLPFARRQPWETFASTCRQAFNDLRAAQLAVLEARRTVAMPLTTMKLEDSIFAGDEDSSLGTMVPEAVAALRLSGTYQRVHQDETERLQAERTRLVGLIADRGKFNGADPAKFDHDGDGKPGGSKPRSLSGSGPGRSSPSRSGPGQPLSVGEKPVRPPRNKGGRGRRKAP